MANAGRRERAARSEDRDRLPPHNLEAEESLLGAMLLSREAVGDAIELVRPDDFFRPSHRQLFEVIVDLYARGETTDLVSVGDELVRRGIMELIGGSETLARLVAETPLISSVERYARIVHEYGILRRLIDAATAIAEEAYGLPTDVRAVLDRAESKILEVASGSRQSAAVGLERVLMEVLDQLEQAANAEDLTSYAVPTGFRDLDELLTGLHRSNLIIVGARPGMGKTSFALSMALNVARTSPEPVLLFSLEMNRLELGQRLVASQARVSSQRLRSGRLTEREWDQVSHAAGELATRPILIDDDPNLTVLDLRARARRVRAERGLSLIVVDYLQLMSGRPNAESRQLEVSEISRGLKLLARELDVPIVALSQLSRNLESRGDRRPQLADLRESGCLSWDTQLTLASGEQRALGWLWAEGARDIPLRALNHEGRLVDAVGRRVVATGTKPVVEFSFADGSRLRATADHRLWTPQGWRAAGELDYGEPVVVVRGGKLTTTDLVGARELGTELVFDVEVPATHSFVADGVVVHNSLEQDADVVMFIYRDEAYHPDTPDRGVAEIIVAKHRNGPQGTVNLAFIADWTRFADIAITST